MPGGLQVNLPRSISRTNELLVLSTFCLLVSPQVVVAQSSEAIQAHEMALFFMEHGKPKESIPLFDKAIQLAPNLASAYMNRGSAYDDIGETTKALADYNKAIELDPNFGPAYLNRGLARIRVADIKNAFDDVNKSVQLRPNHARSYAMRGAVYMAMRKPHEALADFDQALKLDPSERVAVKGRAEVLAMLGQTSSAAQERQRAASMPPSQSEVYFPGAKTHPELGPSAMNDKFKAQVVRWTNVLKQDPKNIEALGFRADAQMRLNNAKAAVDDASEIIRLAPGKPAGYAVRGQAYMALQQWDKALEDFGRLVKIAPKDAKAHALKGAALNNLRRYDEAISEFGSSIELDPNEGSVYVMRGGALMTAKKYDAAVGDISKWIELNPKLANAYLMRADAYMRAGQDEKCMQDLEKALSLNPEEPGVNALIGQLRLKQGRLDDALAALSKSLAKNPKDVKAWIIRGRIHGLQHKNNEALVDYDSALAIAPKDIEALAGRAIVFIEEKKYGEALKDSELAISVAPKLAPLQLAAGSAALGLGDREKALKFFSNALELDPNDAMVYAERGKLYSLHDSKLAAQDFDKAIQLSKEPNSAWLVLAAVAHLGTGNSKQCLAYLEQVKTADPKVKRLVIELRSKAKQQLNDLEGALKDVDEIIAMEKDPKAFVRRGEILFAMKRAEEALKSINQSLEIKPTADAFTVKGAIAIEQNHVDDAVADLGKALELDPKNAKALMTRSFAFKNKNEIEKALQDIDQALVIDPKNVTAWLLRAELVGRSDSNAAVECLNKVESLKLITPELYFLRATAEFKSGMDRETIRDAKEYCRLSEWKLSNSTYATLLGYFAAKRSGDSASAEALLESIRKNFTKSEWPQPVIKYLCGEIKSGDLLDQAKSVGEKTEANTYMGLMAQLQSDRKTAQDCFTWVKDNGDKNFTEYGIALVELKKLSGGK